MKIELTLQQLARLTEKKVDDLELLLKGEGGEPLENAPGIIAELVGDRIKENTQRQFDIAKSKISKSLEKIVKDAGVKDFDGVEDAVQKLADLKASGQGKDGDSFDLTTLKANQLAKIPSFVEFQQAKEAELNELKATYEKTLKAQKFEKISSVSQKRALALLSDPAKNVKFRNQEKQIKTLLKSIEDYGFLDLDEDENPILVDQEGVPIVDSKTQTKIKFDDLVIAEWDSLVGFTAIDPDKKTPQPAAGKTGQQQQSTGIKFDSYEAADKAVRTSNNAKDRMELQKAMNAQFPNGKPK